MLFDFGMFFFHNVDALRQAGTGPYFYYVREIRDRRIQSSSVSGARFERPIKQVDSASNPHVVQVFDHAGRIPAMVLTIPADRLTASDETRITFEQRTAGAPFPIKEWFYPGDLGGEESIYPSTRSDGSSTEPNAAFKVVESPVGAKRIETRP
jgi:hypothetical protein